MLIVRILLLPFTILYATGIIFRNLLYRSGLFSRNEFDFPIICVGNLSAGGTGKTPHIEWLIRQLKDEYKLAVLSRGYRRKTSGYVLADEHATASTIGDEPFQLHKKFPDVAVGVSESRVLGIPNLLADNPTARLVLMDDGFQHLPIKAGFNILLTDYHNRFTKDWLLPSGLLREFRSAYKRAEVIVISKCPPHLSEEERKTITREINPLPHQRVYFSTLTYDDVRPVQHAMAKPNEQTHVLAFSGIAKADLFEEHLKQTFYSVDTVRYKDHHHYTESDLQLLTRRFEAIETKEKIIVCTEKDAVKLQETDLAGAFLKLPVYYLPVHVQFIDGGGEQLIKNVQSFIESYENDN